MNAFADTAIQESNVESAQADDFLQEQDLASIVKSALLATSLKVRLTNQRAACRAAGHNWGARRHPESVSSGVMKSEDINRALGNPDRDLLIHASGVALIGNGTVFFLSDDASFGHGVLPKDFYAISMPLPSVAEPRPGLESGMIRTAEDVITVYTEPNERQLNTLDELVAHLVDGGHAQEHIELHAVTHGGF